MDESIGTKIKECRIKKGLTQKQLGDLIGVSPVMISQYETGIRKPKAETINKLSLALDSKELLMYNYVIHTNESNIIGTKIKECRIKKGLTQKQLGSLCDMTQQQIAQYENGKLIPKEETINKIANALESEELRRIGALRGVFNNQKTYNITFNYDSNEFYNKFFNGLSGLSPDGASYEQAILKSFRQLNKTGKQEAIKRVDELTELPKYTTPDQPDQTE